MSETKKERREYVFETQSMRFMPDNGLMYLIQQTTQIPTDEILGFFYDFGKEVFVQGIAAKDNDYSSIRKDIQALYPGTNIPFKLLVKGGVRSGWDYQLRQPTGKNAAYGTIEVTFPTNSSYIDTSKMIDVIMEKQILGGSSLPDFDPPRSKTPKMYEDLIKTVLANRPQKVEDEQPSEQTQEDSLAPQAQ